MLFWFLGLYFLLSTITLVYHFKNAYEVPSTEEWSGI